MTEPLVLASLSPETQQFLLQIQADRQLSTLVQAAQQVLDEACAQAAALSPAPLAPAPSTLFMTALTELTQCQSQLASAISTLTTVTDAVLPHAGRHYRQPGSRLDATLSGQGRSPAAAPLHQTSLAQAARRGLTGTALAERLHTTPSTISRQRSQVGFGRWSQARDPDGLTWLYSARTRRFHPVASQTVEPARLADPNQPQSP